MENDLIEAVQKRVDDGVPARSVAFDWQGQRYWIKISLKSQMNSWHRVQNFAATILGNPMLRATVSSSGDAGLQAEARRIARLEKRDVLVPKVIAQKPGWLLLSDIGPCLFDEIQKSEHKDEILIKAASALSLLHTAGGWHGTGQLRDMIYVDDKIGFIDFEENVGEAMEAPAAQARDVLRFLISSVRFDAGDGKLLEGLLRTYQEKAPKEVWPFIRSSLNLMRPLAFILAPFHKKLGRDLRHALLVFNALK